MQDFKLALEQANFAPGLKRVYEDINGELPLLSNVWIPSNTHLGQRKLLLNEMAYYNSLPKPKVSSGQFINILYSGSAPGEHTPFILKHYPNIRLIFIDPNYHFMDYDYQYIYKSAPKFATSKPEDTNDFDGEDIGNKKAILSFLKNTGNPRGKHIAKLVKKLFMADLLTSTGIEKIDALNTTSFGDIDNLYNIDDNSNRVNDDSNHCGPKCRVFIIQDFITPELAKEITSRIKIHYYVSDIRIGNHDLGILYDNALQFLIQRALNCTSCLKFVLPKYGDWFKPDIENTLVTEQWMLPVFEECKALGLDFIEEYLSEEGPNNYTYLGGEVHLQPWAREMSGETRLWTNCDIKIYNPMEWRRKFNYHNFYRACCYTPINTNFSAKIYCGCSDCILEQSIIIDYLTIRGDYTAGNKSKAILAIKKEIDIVTFHGLKKHKFNVLPGQVRVNYETYEEKAVFMHYL